MQVNRDACYCGLNYVSQKPTVPVNGISFGNRVFVDITKLR